MFSPDGTAVHDHGGRILTWHELNARANRLADRLCELGAGPHRPVALIGRSQAATIVGWLAAWKADAAVVPLGTLSMPAANEAIALSGARLVLTTGDTPSPDGVAMMPLNLDGPVPVTPNLSSRSLGDQPLLLAPGSQGLVRVLPQDLLDLMRWQTGACQPGPKDRVCPMLSATSPIGLRLIAATLGLEGVVHLPPPAVASGGQGLWNFLQAARITRLFVDADTLAALAGSDEARQATLDDLRDVIALGGTLRLTPDVLRFFALHTRCRVHSLHSAPDSAGFGACSLELPFATVRSLAITPPSAQEPILQSAGQFSALINTPAVA